MQPVIHSDSGFGTVAFLSIKKATLEPKDDHEVECTVPPILDEIFSDIQEEIHHTSSSARQDKDQTETSSCGPVDASVMSRRSGLWVGIAAIQAPRPFKEGQTIEEEVQSCFDLMRGSFPVITMPALANSRRYQLNSSNMRSTSTTYRTSTSSFLLWISSLRSMLYTEPSSAPVHPPAHASQWTSRLPIESEWIA